MRAKLENALERAAEVRRGVLSGLWPETRVQLLEELFEDFFVDQRQSLLKWSALTGQTAQVDTGYIAQHVSSILLGEPGQGFKGKGLDVLDGTEVKSAANLSGVDRPRWNHNMGTVANDKERRAKGEPEKWRVYLGTPNIFYLLFDRKVTDSEDGGSGPMRVRAWCLDSQEDSAWRDLVLRYVDSRKGRKYNLQLHPPVGYDDDIVVNTLGNLDFADVKVFEAILHIDGDRLRTQWLEAPPDQVRPVRGRSTAKPYGGPSARPSRLNAVEDVRVDLEHVAALIGHDRAQELLAATMEEADEAALDASD